MKIIYFLTIPLNPPPPPNIYYMKKKLTKSKGAPPATGWGGGRREVTCSDILVEHYANMSSYMSYLTQT